MASTTKTKLSTDQYKELLAGERKEIKIDLTPSALSGKWETVSKRIKKMVDDSEIEGEFTIGYTKTQGYSRYNYNTGRYDGGAGAKYFIKGSRAYTDAEFEVLGAKLLSDKLKREARDAKARAANLAKFNKLAEKLGLDTVEA